MCTATDHDPQAIRPRKTARAQDTDPHSYCVSKTKGSASLATEAQTQRGFIKERTPLVKPSRTVEDDRDDAMYRSNHFATTCKKKVLETPFDCALGPCLHLETHVVRTVSTLRRTAFASLDCRNRSLSVPFTFGLPCGAARIAETNRAQRPLSTETDIEKRTWWCHRMRQFCRWAVQV